MKCWPYFESWKIRSYYGGVVILYLFKKANRMKIGIVSSWIDTLALFQFLTRYDNEYLVYCDQMNFPYWEKSLDFVLSHVKKAAEFLTEKWAEVIILDPVYELALKYSDKELWFKVLPLFQQYLHEHAFKHSLVGKIGILSDFWFSWKVQKFLENEEQDYKPTEEQKSIKKFSYPFHYRVKSASSWVYNVNDLWVHNPYLIRTMKNDLRYFKDVYVDTILLMNYHYFCMQRAIRSFFNFRKIRFHGFSVVEECFVNLVEKSDWKYWVKVWINQPSEFLTRNKQLMWLMQRGKLVKVDIEEI